MSQPSTTIRKTTSAPEEYGANLQRLSHTVPSHPELYSRVQYQALAHFLTRPIAPSPQTQLSEGSSAQGNWRTERNKEFVHILVYTSSQNAQFQRKDFNLNDGLIQFSGLPAPEANSTQVVFVRGSLSPSWATALGAKYKIDPEFLRQHLRYLDTRDDRDNSDQPSLSSTMNGKISLTVPSLHVQESPLSMYDVRKNRERDSNVARKNQQSIVSRAASGETIVRRFTTLSDRLCSIEHEIAIFTRRGKNNGQVAVVLLDHGLEMNQEGGPPFFSRQNSTMLKDPANGLKQVPVIVPRPSSISVSVTHPPVTTPGIAAPPNSIDHVASYLPFYFGMSHDASSTHSNVIVLMHEIFVLVTSAECQFLNRLRRLLNDQELEPVSEERMSLTLNTIRCIRALAEDHKQQLKRNIASLQLQMSSHTDTFAHAAANSTPASKPKEDRMTNDLTTVIGDFAELLDRTDRLCESCTETLSLIVNGAMLRESQKAIERADNQSRLTVLAYFFLPLTLVASIFGMNVKQLDPEATQSIWLPFVILVPITFMSWVMFYTGTIRHRLMQALRPNDSAHHTQGATMPLRTLKDNGSRMA